MIKFQKGEDSIPPCGHLLATQTAVVSQIIIVRIVLLTSIESIQVRYISWIPLYFEVPTIESTKVLSNAPSMSKKAPCLPVCSLSFLLIGGELFLQYRNERYWTYGS